MHFAGIIDGEESNAIIALHQIILQTRQNSFIAGVMRTEVHKLEMVYVQK